MREGAAKGPESQKRSEVYKRFRVHRGCQEEKIEGSWGRKIILR